MPIQSGDVKLVKSAVMADVSEGGGAPTGIVIADGVSNAIFPDISELDRAGGRVNLRKVFVSVQTDDTDYYFGGNVVVAEPPKDPRVSVTLFSTKESFDDRLDATNRIESYLIRGGAWDGYLFENHVAGQRSILLFQRPGTPLPPVGRTLVLVFDEGKSTEKLQYVRTTKVESTERTFTFLDGGKITDYKAEVVKCDLSDALRYDFKGSPASRFFSADSGATLVRDTIVADAGNYFGVVPLKTAATIGDTKISADSVYSQLVPNARTESVAIDQKPAAQRTLTLATTPRKIEVGVTPHSMRVRVTQESRGYSWVQMLKPRPAPGTVVVSYIALGNWYTLSDDGNGTFTGAGVGQINYQTGSVAATLQAMPDADTSIIFSWGENTAYTNQSGRAGFRAPEFAWETPNKPLKPGTVVVTWYSNNILRTATDDGSGKFSGDATGEVNYATGRVFLQPKNMIDAGGEFNTVYKYTNEVTHVVQNPTVDAGGFATITLPDVPAQNSVKVRWVTVRNVSKSSGSSELVTKNRTELVNKYVTVTVPDPKGGPGLHADGQSYVSGGTVNFTLRLRAGTQKIGTYTYEVQIAQSQTAQIASPLTGSISMSESVGKFSIQTKPDQITTWATFSVKAIDPDGQIIAWSQAVSVANSTSAFATTPGTPSDQTRDPISNGGIPGPKSGMYLGGLTNTPTSIGARVYVEVVPEQDPVTGAMRYDPPADVLNQLWSQAELDAKAKTMQSTLGNTVTYNIWG